MKFVTAADGAGPPKRPEERSGGPGRSDRRPRVDATHPGQRRSADVSATAATSRNTSAVTG
jgi:hypothetical protein